MNTNFDVLVENADLIFQATNIDLGIINSVGDSDYTKFMNEINGGFFFNKALCIYGLQETYKSSSYVEMTKLVNSMYLQFIPNAHYFGCDFLGNQFAFINQKIAFINIESGQFEIIANSFLEWIALIKAELDYYTGQSLVIEWEKENGLLDINKRLCPKKPFIIGGEYSIENLFAVDMESLIKYNFTIAKQIYNLPDGAEIKLIINPN